MELNPILVNETPFRILELSIGDNNKCAGEDEILCKVLR
jgi:hypothetical protein